MVPMLLNCSLRQAKMRYISTNKRHEAQNAFSRLLPDKNETLGYMTILAQRTQYRIYFTGVQFDCQEHLTKNQVIFLIVSPPAANVTAVLLTNRRFP